MYNWFKVKIRFTVVDPSTDTVKVKVEEFLHQAVSYADAEAQATVEHADHQIDFEVSKVSKLKVNEVICKEELLGDESWYMIKVQFITFDEKRRVEKRTSVPILLDASNIVEAHDLVAKKIGGGEAYEITQIAKTTMLDVYKLEGPEKLN